MSEITQHVIVTLVALAAAWLVLRRVLGVIGPQKKSAPGCAVCAANKAQDRRRSEA